MTSHKQQSFLDPMGEPQEFAPNARLGYKSLVMGQDKEVIPLLLDLHSPTPHPSILDCTHNQGKMWEGIKERYALFTLDIDPQWKTDWVGDFRDMHFIEDESFHVLVFDPPHLRDADSPNSSKLMNKRYGLREEFFEENGDNISELFPPFLKEAKRVLKPGGIILAKIADMVHNHQYQWQHIDFILAAREAGLTPCDLLIKGDPRAGQMNSSKWQTIRHLRKAHVYWIVVKKGNC